jgi:hypothetical protein
MRRYRHHHEFRAVERGLRQMKMFRR